MDRLFGELNALLIALAIGLAMLDLTCFAALQLEAAQARSAAASVMPGSLASPPEIDVLDFGPAWP